MNKVKEKSKPKKSFLKMSEAEKEQNRQELRALLKTLKKPKTKAEGMENLRKIQKITAGMGWMSPDFDEPMELV